MGTDGVGERAFRIDAPAMVTGKAKYGADIHVPSMLHGKILRSKYAHARILRIDTTEAVQMSGVKAVITADDVRGSDLFAKDYVRFHGQKIAAVAADSVQTALEAIEAIKVEYEPLTAVTDVRDAIKPDAPCAFIGGEFEEVRDAYGRPLRNISRYREFISGDVEEMMRSSDAVVEGEFYVPSVHQSYLEPHACIALPIGGGKVEIWTSTQGHFQVRSLTARLLGLPLHHIKVIPTFMGGGFGGRNTQVYTEPVAALLALKTGLPVQVIDDRSEVILDSHPAPACYARARLGASKDGTLMALDAEVFWDGGVSGYIGASVHLRGLYRLRSYRIRSYGVYTNKPAPGAYRAPDAPQMAFVRESLMDMLAREIGIDPWELRMKNAVEEGDTSTDGVPLPKVGFKETLKALMDYSAKTHERSKAAFRTASPTAHLNGSAPSKAALEMLGSGNWRVGRGLACGEWTNYSGYSSATVMLNEDGTFQVITGSCDVTGTNTLFAQIVSEELKVPIKKVSVVVGDTESVPWHHQTGGSRVAYTTGMAVLKAAQQLRERMLQIAAKILGVDAQELELGEECICVKDNQSQRVSYIELGRACIAEYGPLHGSHSIAWMPTRPAYAVALAEAAVDLDTGKVKVLRYIAAQDVGKALNPLAIEGQIHGAVMQGIGWATMEGYKYTDDGRVANATLADYLLPTSTDAAEIEPVIVEVPNPDGPYGAKGVGEPSIIPSLAAIANAVSDAIGKRVTSLPMTPERIVMVLMH
ncbi:MAG: xanthine dehydrogenase family protein molybdopterin-binding subunit [Armatimonadota bacterium]|nr:xanthine dehydrogenase family protein molybdopterin-binding subunit [Armatimonadota bacterium]MDW8024321.1 xanthine dehydrogenase family protein molybdopterin-binding subunit [Armatimonadota bacterium]